MDGLQEKRARKLVNQLERADNCGLLAIQGTVVLRCPARNLSTHRRHSMQSIW